MFRTCMAFSRAPVRNGTRLPRGGGFLPGTGRENICRMIEQSSPGKARDILVACCKRKEGKGIWSIARELMRPYSTVRGWLVRMMRRGLGGRFDRKSTGRKKILDPQTLKKIMEWTRWDPSRYGFEPASWHLDMVNEVLRRETGRHAKPALFNSSDLTRTGWIEFGQIHNFEQCPNLAPPAMDLSGHIWSSSHSWNIWDHSS